LKGFLAGMSDRPGAAYALTLLFFVNAINFFDRSVLGAVTEPVRKEWNLSDTALGYLGTAFILLYAVVGLPLGRLADKVPRKPILAAGLVLWSVLTAASGLARSYGQLFLLRLGVGVGEASCAPAATSLLGDFFPPAQRGKALSLFMLGLPVGIGLSYFLSGRVAQDYSWRHALFVAGLPGLLCALALVALKEPPRGAAEAHKVGGLKRQGSPFLLVLSVPTMWWLILSGALLNFNTYATGMFLTSLLMRFHGLNNQDAADISGVVYGLSGIPGLLLGGMIADRLRRRRLNGRLLAGAISALLSVPLVFLALLQGKGSVGAFSIFMGLGCAAMYVYYSAVYPTIQDVIEPSLRGTAMAVYFFSMYVLGAALGPALTGSLSDYFTRRAAGPQARILPLSLLEPFRAEGLHSAMYVLPLLGAVLAWVLFLGSRTVAKDSERLVRWMRESSGQEK
jgi:MFS family permease